MTCDELTAATAARSISGLAAELAEVLLGHDPFAASFMSVSGYEDAVPDLSAQGLLAWRSRLVDIIVRCGHCEPDPADTDSRVLLGVVRDKAARALAVADSRVEEYSVTTFPLGGPSLMLLIAARTRLTDAAAAADYLTRCTRLAGYLDQVTAMLRDAARDGLLPVAPLVSDVIGQLSGYLARPEQDPLLTRQPPRRWAGAAEWRAAVERVVRDSVHPAVGRYADLLVELLPRSRPPERAGLVHLPGGVAAYACWVRDGTTLPLDPDELHRIGLAAVSAAATPARRWPGFALTLRPARAVAWTRWTGLPRPSPGRTSAWGRYSARRCPRARSSRCRRTWPSPARRPTTRLPREMARAPARTCSIPSSPAQRGAGQPTPPRSTRGCPATTCSSPGCRRCPNCRSC